MRTYGEVTMSPCQGGGSSSVENISVDGHRCIKMWQHSLDSACTSCRLGLVGYVSRPLGVGVHSDEMGAR